VIVGQDRVSILTPGFPEVQPSAISISSVRVASFNPHPRLPGGATLRLQAQQDARIKVSILTPGFPEVQRHS